MISCNSIRELFWLELRICIRSLPISAYRSSAPAFWLDGVYYSRLPFYAFALKPLGRLPYPVSYRIFQGISLLAYVGFMIFFLSAILTMPSGRRCSVAVADQLSLGGQDLALVLLFAGLFVACADRGWDALAGSSCRYA